MIEKEPSLFDDFVIKKPLTRGVRFTSMFLDHVFVCLLATPLAFINNSDDFFSSSFAFSYLDLNYYLFLVVFAIYFSKDCIAGRSLAKRILKLQVVDNKTGKAATPFQCLIRNIFIFLWLIEVIVILFNPERRLGDRLAGTRVVFFDPKKESEKINVLSVILSFILAFGFFFFLSRV